MIPLGGMGDIDGPQMILRGPPPIELEAPFGTIKKSVFIIIVAIILQIVSATYIVGGEGLLLVFSDNMVNFLMLFIAVWLLKEDPMFGKVFNCLGNSICNQCSETCPNSMGCLRTYYFTIGLQVVFTILRWILDLASDRSEYNLLKKSAESYQIFWICYNAGRVLVSIGQLLGCVVAKQTYDKAMRMGLGVPAEQDGFGGPGGGLGGGGGFGGGGLGGGRPGDQEMNRGGPAPFSGRTYNVGGNNNNEDDPETGRGSGRNTDNAPAREAQPASNFVAFGGQGNRLGT